MKRQQGLEVRDEEVMEMELQANQEQRHPRTKGSARVPPNDADCVDYTLRPTATTAKRPSKKV